LEEAGKRALGRRLLWRELRWELRGVGSSGGSRGESPGGRVVLEEAEMRARGGRQYRRLCGDGECCVRG
jgi:hypothetical protein